jgi:hypothetical protein
VDDGTETIRHRATALFWLLACAACTGLVPHLALASCVRPATAPPICVVGTITAKSNSAALVETPGVTGSDWLHAGDTTAGWTIAEIGAGYVLVKTAATPVAETHVTERAAARRGPLINSHSRQRRGEGAGAEAGEDFD